MAFSIKICVFTQLTNVQHKFSKGEEHTEIDRAETDS